VTNLAEMANGPKAILFLSFSLLSLSLYKQLPHSFQFENFAGGIKLTIGLRTANTNVLQSKRLNVGCKIADLPLRIDSYKVLQLKTEIYKLCNVLTISEDSSRYGD